MLTPGWEETASGLATQRWARLGAVAAGACDELEAAAPDDWSEMPAEDHGRVREGSHSLAYCPFDSACSVVRNLGGDLASGIEAALGLDVPPFNEVTWTKYAPGAGFITRHRDPGGIGGVIAIVTLRGSATFRVWDSGGTSEWTTSGGDIVLLAATDWPATGAQCPDHEVEPPVGERVILTLRYNRGGVGADPFAS